MYFYPDMVDEFNAYMSENIEHYTRLLENAKERLSRVVDFRDWLICRLDVERYDSYLLVYDEIKERFCDSSDEKQ